ncbi:MAG: ribbon-helix-helix domain-containing protein [Rhodospirillaceae bacterium]|nr:ribbon-helix-helix domain-containing protein [Rhodospirillaceae bacterium]
MRHRIIQHAGKRYSLKLDPVVWEALESIAAEDGIRLNELVARIAREGDGRSSLTEALRVHCVRRSQERAAALQQQLESRALTAVGVPLGLIVDASPAPTLLISQDQIIRRANAAAQKWIGAPAQALTGKSVHHYLQVRAARPLAEIMADFAAGQTATFPARVLYLQPGRVIVARATLCPALRKSPESFSYLLMIDDRDGR